MSVLTQPLVHRGWEICFGFALFDLTRDFVASRWTSLPQNLVNQFRK